MQMVAGEVSHDPVRDGVARPPEQVIALEGTAEREWNDFVTSRADATGYHLWGWRRVFESVFGHDCLYLAARRGDRVVGVLPLVLFDSRIFGRFAVSLPFLNYGGVIADNEAAAKALLDAGVAAARERKLSHIELRHLDRRFPDLPAKRHKVAMLLTLPGDSKALWDRIDRKVRNQVRKAEKSELTSASGGAELVPEFYTVFAQNM